MDERDRRRETVTALLDHWRDFFEEPAESGRLVVIDEQREMADDWSLFSAMGRWPSVVELRRCVDLLERLGGGRTGEKVPVHHRHLMAFTAYVEWRLVDKPVKRRDHRGRMVDDVERVRDRVVPSWVNGRIVGSALDMVLGLWNRSVPLELPPALGRKLHEFVDPETGEIGWTEAA